MDLRNVIPYEAPRHVAAVNLASARHSDLVFPLISVYT